LTSGIRIGVRISTVGVKSSAVPTMTIKTIITSKSIVGLSFKGSRIAPSSAGMLACVISHAEIRAAATRNITAAVVLAATRNTP
jgi:hypothetical protein